MSMKIDIYIVDSLFIINITWKVTVDCFQLQTNLSKSSSMLTIWSTDQKRYRLYIAIL